MSEIITSAPFEPGDNERRINSVPINFPTHWVANEKPVEPIEEPELLDLNLDDMQELIPVDQEQLELEAPISQDTLEALEKHDEFVNGRFVEIDSFNGKSVARNEKIKNDSVSLGEEIKMHAISKAEANKKQILEGLQAVIDRAREAARYAIEAVERKAVTEMQNGESIQELGVRLYEAATEVLQQLASQSNQGKEAQLRSVRKRTLAIEGKNNSIETMESLFAEVQKWQAKMDAARTTILEEHEVSRINVMNDEGKIDMAEDKVLKPLKPAVIAEMSRLLQTDMQDKLNDDVAFKDKMREVARQLAQPESKPELDTSGITPEVVRDSAVNAKIDPDAWFFVQRRRAIVLDRKDHVYRLIEREEANIAEAQGHYNDLIEKMAGHEQERDRQHGIYKNEEQNEGVKIEVRSTILRDIAETVNHILNGDASSINEASILGKFQSMLDEEGRAPEKSIPGQLVGMLDLKRRLQKLIQDSRDAGDNLPIAPQFNINNALPVFDVDGESAIDTMNEFGDAADKQSAILDSMKLGHILTKEEMTKFIGKAILKPTALARGVVNHYISADLLKDKKED